MGRDGINGQKVLFRFIERLNDIAKLTFNTKQVFLHPYSKVVHWNIENDLKISASGCFYHTKRV